MFQIHTLFIKKLVPKNTASNFSQNGYSTFWKQTSHLLVNKTWLSFCSSSEAIQIIIIIDGFIVIA